MKKFYGLLILCFCVSISAAGQEVCNNGIDDDKDGFIDCFDGECANNSACEGGYLGNDVDCEAKPSAFPEFKMAIESVSEDGTATHLGRVVVGDLDRDGFPEMVSTNQFSKKIFILNGESTLVGGKNINTIQKQLSVSYSPSYTDVLIANLDNDNCSEIFVIATDWTVYAYDCNLNQLWSVKLPGDPGMMGLADFNGDGKTELYARNAIYNAHTGAVIVAPTASWGGFNGGPVAVDILQDATKSVHLPTDATKDDNLELVCGLKIFSVNISAGTINQEKSIAEYGKKTASDATSIADYNSDGSLDVIASGRWASATPAADGTTDENNTTIFFWDVKTNIVKTFSDAFPDKVVIKSCKEQEDTYYKDGWHQGTGRVNIADTDGDGKLNAIFVSGKYLYTLREDLTVLWRKVVNEETSGNTGCTLFDFNGDGKSEVVYRDEKYIYIIDGTTGASAAPQPCVSRTNREYPIVADVDADGNSELCVTCRTVDFYPNGSITNPNDPNYSKTDLANFCDLNQAQYSQVRIFRSGGEPWVPARRVWNQHGYFNVNVNDNLTIPKVQQKHHLVFSTNVCTNGANRPLNTFLNQSPFLNSQGCPKYAAPDLAFVNNSLTITSPTCPEEDFTVSFQVTNKGDLTVSGSIPVSFYDGDPLQSQAVKLGTLNLTLSSLKAGDLYTVTNAPINGSGSAFTLYIVLNDAGTSVPPITLPNSNFLECDYTNNILSAPVIPKPSTITAVREQDNIKCAPGTTADNGAVRAFVLDGTIENSTDYTFYWSAGTSVKATADFEGAIWTGRPAGTYTVFAVHKTKNCSSDTTEVTVQDVNRTVDADIILVHEYTNCSPANGALRVVVNDTDKDGVGENPNSFTYTWYEGNDIFTSPQIGIDDTAKVLSPLSYTVLVKDKVTGCQTIESLAISDKTVIPTVSASAIQAICSDPASGGASADVEGITVGYTFKWFNGNSVKPAADFTGSSYANRPVGNYTVVAMSNATQCTSLPKTITVDETAPPIVNVTVLSDQTSCDPAQPTGSASASVNGVTTGFSFEWFKGQNTLTGNLIGTSSNVSNLTNTIYTVKATNSSTGCSTTKEITIQFAVATPVLTLGTSTDPTNCSAPNGAITIQVDQDAASAYSFSWYKGNAVKAVADFSDTDETLAGLEPGTYTVQAINNNRHCETAAISITLANAAPVIVFSNGTLIPPTTCSDNGGSITVGVSASGNTSGFDFEWRKGQSPFSNPPIATFTTTGTSTTVTGLSAGAYTLIATNRDNGCTSSHLIDLPFVDAQSMEITNIQDIETCTPGTDGSISVKLIKTVGFAESDYRIDVYTGANDPGASGTPFTSINPVNGTTDYTLPGPIQPGSYTFVAVTINPARATFNCRSVPVTAEIVAKTQAPVFTASTVVPNVNCAGASGTGRIELTLTSPTSGPAGYTFDWFEGTGTGTPLGTATSGIESGINGENAINLTAGKYSVVVTKNSGASAGCSATSTYEVFDNIPVISLLTADITATHVSRCDVSNGSITVNFVTENNAQLPASDYTFEWYTDTGSVPQLIAGANTNSLTNRPSGNYYVKPVNSTSNCSTAELIGINILDKTNNTVSVALVDFTTPTTCLKPANIEGQLEVLADGTSTTGYTYNWYPGQTTAGPQLTGSNVAGTDSEIARMLTAGYYTIEVINNSTQCIITDTYELPNEKRPVTIASSGEPLTVCFTTPKDGTVFAAVTSGSKNDYTYNWYSQNVKATPDFTSTANTPVTNLSPSTYIVIAVDNLDATCFVSDTVIVRDEHVNPIASAISMNDLTVCDPSNPDGVASASVDGDFINYTFDWYASAVPSGTSFYTGAQVFGLSAQIYSVIATSVLTGCSGSAQVTIQQNSLAIPAPEIETLSLVTSCIEGNGMLAASVNGNTSDYIFTWYIGNQQKASADFTGEFLYDLAVGTYSVTATSRETGCTSRLVTGDLGDNLLYPDFTYTTTAAVCRLNANEEGTGLAAVFVTNGVDIESIVWQANNTTYSGTILSGVDAGIYPVTVTTTLGCATTKEVEIKSEIHPYNGISRSPDNQNDLFLINCIEDFPMNSVKIFNRAGTLVYEAEGYDNTANFFDGKSNKGISLIGNDLPAGTYFYIIDKHDGSKPIAGYLELVN